MKKNQYDGIAHLEGLEFVKELLVLEQTRFESDQFLKGSTFEDINADFGIFPTIPTYPVYFTGDITMPEDKIIFMGINPGFKAESNIKEQAFLDRSGLFEGYCRLFGDFHFEKKGLLPYFAHIAGFLRRYFGIVETIDWDWYQNNFITLELVPYHSADVNGLRFNNIKKYREIYFEILLKFLKYLNPKKPIFINGFPTCKKLLEHSEFHDKVTSSEHDGFWTGKIGEYDFIGLPFLNRPRGGKDVLVSNLQRHFPMR